MLSLQRTLSLGYLQQRWMRAALVVLSVALGVATMVATRTLSRNLNQAAENAANPLSGLADLSVVNGMTGVPLEVARRLDPRKNNGPDSPSQSPALAAIRSVLALVFGRVTLPDLNNRSVLMLGLDTWGETPSAGAPGTPGNLPGLEIKPVASVPLVDLLKGVLAGKVPVMISVDLASAMKLDPEDTSQEGAARANFRIRLAGTEKQALVVGVVHVRTEKLLPEKEVIFMTSAPASSLIYPGRSEYVTQVNISLKKDSKREEVRRGLQELFRPPLKVQTVQSVNETLRDVTAGLELGFAIGGIGALVVGLFLVYNALSVSVAERRHDIGILRSVGATRTQIAGLFVSEALVLGLVGSLLGLPIGYGLALIAQAPLVRVLSDMAVPMEATRLSLDGRTTVLALLAGMITTILAALVPALQAAREEPADVVRRIPSGYQKLYRILQCSACLLLLLAGLVCVLWRESLPVRAGTFTGIVCILVACLLAMPLLTLVVARFLQPFFRVFLGLEGRLAADNLARSPGRTGLVIAALAATGALLVQTAGFIDSTELAIMKWLDESVAADFFVTGGASMTTPGTVLPMSEAVGRQLTELPGVDVALGIRFHAIPYRNRLVVMIALDTDAFANASRHHALGRDLSRYPQLRQPGKALVSKNFAALYKVKAGDKIQIDGPEGPLELEVIDTVVDYTWNRGTIIVDRAWFREKFRDNLVDIFDVYMDHNGRTLTEEEREAAAAAAIRGLKKGTLAQAVQSVALPTTAGPVLPHALVNLGIASRMEEDPLFGTSRGQLRATVKDELRRVYSLAYAQQAVVGLVALLGVISALFISVLQRRRELGLLRAVGASRNQVLRSVLAEAVLMGLVGAVLGLLTGVLLEWYIMDVVILDESGLSFPMSIPWKAAGVVFTLSVLLATAVGLWPALQATRIRIAEAIAYE